MSQPQYDIFISYRREDGKDFARHMQLKLQNYGYSVFLDFDELKDGTFDRRILDAIESAPVFMVILSPHALDRCRDENDWVRREIEHAITHNRHIVPVNPDRRFAGFPEDCPSSVRAGLGQHQFTEIFTGQQFMTTVDDMVRIRIRPVLEKTNCLPREEIGAIIHIETDVDCRVLKFGKEIGLAHTGEDIVIRLRKGKHKLEFVSTENPSDRRQTVFAVEDNEMEDFIQVELADIRAARLEAERREQERREQERREQECKEHERRLAIPDKDICCFEENRKIGFKVKSTGELLIPPKYNDAWNFDEGLAMVRLNGKCGYIDKNDEEVIPLKYGYVGFFREGLAKVELNGKYGYIDKNGKEVIPLKYDYVWIFDNGLVKVKLNNKYGYIDKDGKEVIPLKYDDAKDFNEGLTKVELNGKYGHFDKNGIEVIPLKYDDAKDFREGLAKVKLNNKYGYIDINGIEVIPLKYDDAWNFRGGLAQVELNGKCGYIDKDGIEVIPLKYDDAKDFREDLAQVELNGKCGYIDINGKEVLHAIYKGSGGENKKDSE